MAQVNRRSLAVTPESDVIDPTKRSNLAFRMTSDYVKLDLQLKPGEATRVDFTLKLVEKAGAPDSK